MADGMRTHPQRIPPRSGAQSRPMNARSQPGRAGGPNDLGRRAKPKGSARDSGRGDGTGEGASPSKLFHSTHEGVSKFFCNGPSRSECAWSKNKNFGLQDLIWGVAERLPVGGLDE